MSDKKIYKVLVRQTNTRVHKIYLKASTLEEALQVTREANQNFTHMSHHPQVHRVIPDVDSSFELDIDEDSIEE